MITIARCFGIAGACFLVAAGLWAVWSSENVDMEGALALTALILFAVWLCLMIRHLMMDVDH